MGTVFSKLTSRYVSNEKPTFVLWMQSSLLFSLFSNFARAHGKVWHTWFSDFQISRLYFDQKNRKKIGEPMEVLRVPFAISPHRLSAAFFVKKIHGFRKGRRQLRRILKYLNHKTSSRWIIARVTKTMLIFIVSDWSDVFLTVSALWLFSFVVWGDVAVSRNLSEPSGKDPTLYAMRNTKKIPEYTSVSKWICDVLTWLQAVCRSYSH